MTREEVIDYYYNIKNFKKRREFLKRWVEERREKEWNDVFLKLIDWETLMNCFRDMFILHEINTVENIKTGEILRLV